MDSKKLAELVRLAPDKESAVNYGFRQAKIELKDRMLELEAQAGNAHAVLAAIRERLGDSRLSASADTLALHDIEQLVEDYFASE